MDSILYYFPIHIRKELEDYFVNSKNFSGLEEIRIRTGKYILLKFIDFERIVRYLVSTEDILQIMQRICENSIYSFQNQISSGYITVKGGHRVGISGSTVIENGKVININYIYSLNFRISRQIIGSSDKILTYILNKNENTVYNTLLVSPPGYGKTTLLRDLIRQIGNGIKDIKFKGLNIGVVDERSEISAMYKGMPQNDVGLKTDILDNVPKYIGMKMLVRSMAPDVIVADEIGMKEDIEAINYTVCSGVKGIFTAHGKNLEDVYLNPILKELIKAHVIERIIFLGEEWKLKGDVTVYSYDRNVAEYIESKG